MRKLCLLLALIPIASWSQEFTDQSRFGKTEADVLAMTHDKWVDWYTSPERGTNSTIGQAEAERIYCTALTNRNRKKISELPTLQREHFEKTEALMNDLSKSSAFIGQVFTGGGTIWQILIAGANTNGAQVLSDCLNPPVKGSMAKQSDVWAAVKVAKKSLDSNRKNMESTLEPGGPTVEQAMIEFARLTKLVSEMVKNVEQSSAQEKGRIFWYLVKVVRMATLEG